VYAFLLNNSRRSTLVTFSHNGEKAAGHKETHCGRKADRQERRTTTTRRSR